MQKRWFTRLRGTPFTAYGPVTRRRPLSSCLRKTTRRPRKRPARRISTVPGVIDFRSFVGFCEAFTFRGFFATLPFVTAMAVGGGGEGDEGWGAAGAVCSTPHVARAA